jgi:hypothetical protein
MIKRIPAVALCLFASVAIAQQAAKKGDDELTARQIFDLGIKAPAVQTGTTTAQKSTKVAKTRPVEKPTEKLNARPFESAAEKTQKSPDGTSMVAAGYTPLALRYSILQEKGDRFVEVDPDTEFHSGDRIRVKVESNGTAFLYIVMGGSSGQWQVLFPSKEIDGGNNKISKAQVYTIPPERDAAFHFDEKAGVEKVSLVLSRTPEPDLEKLIYAAGDPTRADDRKMIMARNSPIDDAVVGGMREKMVTRDLVFEKYDGPAASDGKSEKAVYAATRDKSPDARLFVDLKLIHK